jgi:simple sugar transport system substrate-binding protein
MTQSIKHVFDQVGVKSGDIPVVGWGNPIDAAQEVLDGYVKVACGRIHRQPAIWPYR